MPLEEARGELLVDVLSARHERVAIDTLATRARRPSFTSRGIGR